ncbi:MAG: DUF2059 domain-containing protein [Caulobacteraceae bacterium]|nr:DUF2059 domain-containing protein [Caulobacteraceae bacterium]
MSLVVSWRGNLVQVFRALVIAVTLSVADAATAQMNIPTFGVAQNVGTRLLLAERSVEVTHREELTRRTYQKELMLAWKLCEKKSCQEDLDQAISDAARNSARIFAHDIAQLYAIRLTEHQLIAAISFAESPDGQAIIKSTDGMTDEMARMAHSMAKTAWAEVSRRFCPSHPDLCESPIANSPPPPNTQRN